MFVPTRQASHKSASPPGVPADLKQERKPVRRPGGFEIRRKKMS